MDKGKIREARGRRLFKDIAKAVGYLHNMNISHRDLKGENILIKLNQKVSFQLIGTVSYKFISEKT